MIPQPLMIQPHCRSSLCRVVCRLRITPPPGRLSHHSRHEKNDQPRRDVSTATTDGTHNHRVATTVPEMGRGIRVGMYATITRSYSMDDVESFGNLIRDLNPLHSSSFSFKHWETGKSDRNDDDDADLFEMQRLALEAAGLVRWQTGGTTKPLVHGIFVSGIFSSIFADIVPGCVYVNQGLDFSAPVFVEDTVVGCIHIKKIRDWRRRKGGVVAECHTRVYKVLPTPSEPQAQGPAEAQLVVKGIANVWLPIGTTTSER